MLLTGMLTIAAALLPGALLPPLPPPAQRLSRRRSRIAHSHPIAIAPRQPHRDDADDSSNIQAAASPAVDGSTAADVAAILGVVALLPLLAFGVATTLGMTGGSADNDGLGVPLSLEEVRQLNTRQQQQTLNNSDEEDVGSVRSIEEAAEEQALVDILRGGVIRAR